MIQNKPARRPFVEETSVCPFCGEKVFTLSMCSNVGQADRCYHNLKE